MCLARKIKRMVLEKNCVSTYLQKESPLGLETQMPPFLHGLGEHETKPKTEISASVGSFILYIFLSVNKLIINWKKYFAVAK